MQNLMKMKIKRLLTIICCFLGSVSMLTGQAYPDRHSTGLNDGWLSCTPSSNPNPARGTSHWIMYNLGDTYALTSSTVWNFNTPERINSYNNESWSIQPPLAGKLEDGLRDVLIDLSTDGVTWKEHGRFTIPKAPGSSFYQGVAGPDFNGKTARYVLITATSNHGGSCYGLGEFRIMATAITTSNTNDPLADAIIVATPNPFRDNTTVTLTNFPVGNTSVSLTDLLGREFKKFNITIGADVEKIDINSADLPSGMYILQIIQNEATKSIKLEVLR